MKSNEVALLEENVRAGGGTWIGVQTYLDPGFPDIVVFKAPSPNGVVLSLPVFSCSPSDVRLAIAESTRKQRVIKIPYSRLVQLLEKVTELAEQVKQIIEEKR